MPLTLTRQVLYNNKCKKLQFIHKLTASDTSKTAKITKWWYYPPAHRLNVNVLLSNITFLWFLHLYLQFHYISELLQQNCLFGLPCLHKSFVLTGIDHANQFLVFFHLNFLFDSTWKTNLCTRQFLMARTIHSCIIIIMGRWVVLS